MSGEGVLNGQLANQTSFNQAFLARNGTQTDTIAKVDLNNGDAPSGSAIINLQRNINSLASAMGISPNQAYNLVITWLNTIVGSGSSNIVSKIEAIVERFHNSTGHDHTGTDGEAPRISALDLVNINKYIAQWQEFSKTGASGTSVVVNTEMSGKVAGGSTITTGVLTTAPDNRCWIIDSSTETFIEDAGGQRVYGRITWDGTDWKIFFYTNEVGVETAHSLVSTNIRVYFPEVFTIETRPTIPSNPALFGTLDITGDVVDANPGQRGVVNTGAQSFGGVKTFADTTQSTGIGNGSVVMSGGVGIAKKLFVGETINQGSFNGTVAKALSSSTGKDIVEALTTLVELNYLQGASSNIQAQINLKTDVNNKTEAIAAGGSFSQPTKYHENYSVSGDTAPRTASGTPLGTNAPSWDGAEITLVGNSDANPVTITHNDSAFGVICGIDITLYRGSVLKIKWINSMSRYIVTGRFEMGV